MITLKKWLLLFTLFQISFFAIAQSGIIKGKVSDESNEPLAGASVTVLNSMRGVTTDSNGLFEIRAADNETLIVSFLGFETKSVYVGKRSYIEVSLVQQTNSLNELVVVGYGTQKKVNLTGSASTLNYADEVKSRPVTSAAQILQGMNAGIMVSQSSGQPGSEGLSIRVRGVGTLNASDPLIIIDGFQGTISNVNPDDIENVSILKDAASCAIYGNRGANGVILITTKMGSKGSDKVNASYSGMMAINSPASHFEVMSNYADYMSVMNESAENINAGLPFSQAMIDLWREKSKEPNAISDSGYPNYVAYPN